MEVKIMDLNVESILPLSVRRDYIKQMVRNVERTGAFVASLWLTKALPLTGEVGEKCRALRRFLKYYECI
jgi:hypothetical protein